MKTQFNNPELTHIWANQQQAQGKGSSMFFENESIYSYGYHFKIAQIVEHNNKKAVLFNNKTYSNTTNKHQSLVKRAIPSQYPVFNVNSFPDTMPLTMMHSNNLISYLNNAEETQQKLVKATKSKEAYVNLINVYLNSFCNYCEFYELKDLSIFTLAKLQGLSIQERFLNITNFVFEYTNSESYINWQHKRVEKERIAFEKALSDAADKIQHFRDFKVSTVWGIGTNLLRFNKETEQIETSGGVKMPKNIFFDAYQRLKSNTLLIGQHIGQYRFNGLENDTLLVGCHKIPVNEVENLVLMLG
jgi:hypothetical protein